MPYHVELRTEVFDDYVRSLIGKTPLTVTTEGPLTVYRFFESEYTIEVDTENRTVMFMGDATKHMSAASPSNVIESMVRKRVTDKITEAFGGKVDNVSVSIPYWYQYSGTPDVSKDLRTSIANGGQKLAEAMEDVKLYNDDIMALMNDIIGSSCFQDYNYIWRNLEGINEIKEKSPGLYPFLSDLYGHRMNQFRDAPEKIYAKHENLLSELKDFVMEKHGLTKGDWKIFCKLNLKQAQWIRNDSGNLGVALVLQVMRELGKFPRVTAIRAVEDILSNWRLNSAYRGANYVKHDLLTRMVKAALVGSFKSRDVRHWCKTEWEQVQDWFFGEGVNLKNLDDNQLKAGWVWFKKRSEAWHDEQAKKNLPAKLLVWESLVEAFADEEKKLGAVPLVSNHDLIIEGNSQHHCVGGGTYERGCLDGRYRIFSIRDMDGNRLATCQLSRTDAGSPWREVQTRGKRNSTPTPAVMEFARNLAVKYNEAERKIREEAEKARKAEEREAKKAAKEAAKSLTKVVGLVGGTHDGPVLPSADPLRMRIG